MQNHNMPNAILILAACLVLAKGTQAAESSPGTQPDYLEIVKAYAEALVERGRDTYGTEHSPLFAAALDLKSLKPDLLPERLTMNEERRKKYMNTLMRDRGKTGGAFKPIRDIRGRDRCTTGANPMHDQNLYQILYALTEITGEKKYAAEADKTLKFFFKNCQSPTTGLLAWGEHIGWDFTFDNAVGDTHEFFRPWVLWDRCIELAPDAVMAFAKGLWDHQIDDHETGEFSRHASWAAHGTGGQNEYPRHGGFYIVTWSKAYGKTKDPLYVKAVETLVDMYDRLSSEKTGAIPCSTNPDRKDILWPESNLSLAIDLTDSATVFPQALQKKMLDRARKTDKVYLSLKHDFSRKGIGFVCGADIHTLEACASGNWTHTQAWASGYGKPTDSQIANLCYLRYLQLADGSVKRAYGKLIAECANRYLDSRPDVTRTIFPGTMGKVILLMLAAYDITGDKKYLDRADVFAGIAIRSFLSGSSPLPRTSSIHDHYETITRGDTMMMALLKLWQVRNRPDLSLDLIYTDR